MTNKLADYDEGLRALFPGGYARPSMDVGPTLPPMLVSGDGAWVTDEFGRRLLDLNGNFTANIHGHGRPEIMAVARRVLEAGVSFGAPTPHELAHAEALVGRVAGAERVKYAASGTEAVMTAVRIARAFTGRSKLILLGGAYHGSSDLMVLSHGPRGARGVPAAYAADLIALPGDDPAALAEAADRAGDDLAAVLIDLMPNYLGLRRLSPGFVQAARALTAARGACLIVDEVVNFRHAVGGLQSLSGVVADLTVLGKLIGGGFPIGAVVGPAEIMATLDPSARDGLIHGGTFAATPLAMAAGRCALDLLDAAAIDALNRRGEAFRARLRAALPAGAPWEVRGFGSLARLVPAAGAAPGAARALWWRAVERGVLMTPSGLMALATPMTDADLDHAADAVAAAAETP